MNFLRFLGASGGVIVEEGGTWGTDLWEGLEPVLIGIFAVIGVLAAGYSIFLGIMLAKATDESKRQQAKSRIVKTLAGLFIVVILFSSMTIPGADGRTLLDNILVGTTNRVHYQLTSVNFSIDDTNKQLVLLRDGEQVTDFGGTGVEFRIETTGDAGLSVNNQGIITATGPGSGVVEVIYNGNAIFQQLIIIRAKEVPPPPPERLPADPVPPPPTPPPSTVYPPESGQPGDPWQPPALTGKALQDFVNLATSFLGRSGYAQLGTPNRNTVSYASHHFVNGQRVNMTIRYFDCSSFTQYMFASVGVQIGSTVSNQKATMQSQGRMISRSQLQPGDLVGWSGSVGIYLGNIGTVRRFGSYGTSQSSQHMLIKTSGGTGSGAGYFWSNYKGSTYRAGTVYTPLNFNNSGIWYARPYAFRN